jgi:serine protease
VNNDNNPLDDHGHGTHTAGTSAATGNNAVGVVGVAWRGQVMALKFLAANGNGSDLHAAEATRYAADHGARVSNNSYGGGDGGTTLFNAIQYAGTRQHVFVAAAGNNGRDTDQTPHYPSGYDLPNILSVAATTSTGALAGFSNFGSATVDLGAPGVGILSTTPGSGYGGSSGTSMAAPHVAGTVALLLAQFPTWTAGQVIDRILATVTPNAALAGRSVTGGLVNAADAVDDLPATATFVGVDETAQGDWASVSGADGYSLARGPAALPGYAQVSLAGQLDWVWAASTADPRALQKPGLPDRLAACWFSGTSVTLDVNLIDGQQHAVALYLVDWDRRGRAAQVDVLDAATGAVLHSHVASNFGEGQHLVYTLGGHVRVRLTPVNSPNVVLSGLFFGDPVGLPEPPDPPEPPSGTVAFVGEDATTRGDWQSAYGTEGYSLAQGPAALPAYSQVALAGQSNWVWAASTLDPRALQKPGQVDRLAACWYAGGFTIDVNLTDGFERLVALYLVDWDARGRTAKVEVLDAGTEAVMHTWTVPAYADGLYLVYQLGGHVRLRVSAVNSSNVVVSGLFFDALPS